MVQLLEKIKLSIVGKSVPRVDALDKVTGKAKYTSEEGLGWPGMLYGKVLYSPHAHANIVSIDVSKARRLPGVKAVLTGEDVPEHRSGVVLDDRHVLCREKVRFVGDAVAAVAAESMEIAEEALGIIEVKYEVLPAIFDVEEAFKPDCPVVLHPDLPNYIRPVYAYLGNDLPGPNVHTHHKIRTGNVEEGFKQADLIVENRFQNDRITHCQLEPYNAVCYPDSSGGVTLWTSGRIFMNRGPICRAFNLPATKVRMRTVYVGGMFGMVGRPERFVVLLALKTGRPVKMVYTREECFIDGLNRLPKLVYIKDGVKKDGTLIAREMKVIVNCGAYTDHAPMTIRNGAFHASQYRMPHFKWDAYGVYTNEPGVAPLRGFGSAEVLWATEQQMDITAEKLGIDPVEYRMKNTPDEGEINVRGEIVHSIGAKECLTKAADWIGLDKPYEQPIDSNIRRGKGIALGNKYSLVDTASTAFVKVDMDGTIEVYHGMDECGQGCNTVFTQIAAEEFNLPLDKVRIVWGDTARIPWDHGTSSSRGTLYVGNAIRMACRDAKRQMFEIAAPILGTTPENLDTKNGRIFIKDSPEMEITIGDLSLSALPEARGALKMASCLADGGQIIGRATFWGRPSEEDPETGRGESLTMSYCYGAQAAEVAVDVETGLVKVLRFCSAFDMGIPVNPKMVEGQMEGGAGMGIGSALFEGFVFNDKGRLLNPNFNDYRLPSAVEVPSGDNMGSIIVEAPHQGGPFGAKGMGEAAMNASAPAIANAIYNATGVRLHRIPMTPERVLEAIKENQNKR